MLVRGARSRVFAGLLLAVIAGSGCLAGSGSKRGSGTGSDETDAPDDDEPAACETNVGAVLGNVYYFAPPEDVDSVPADTVDVLLTQGGQTFRTTTTPTGRFELTVPGGDWTFVADDHTGCLNGRSETITVEACELNELTLVIDYCSGG